jgi:hypothetical protein
MKNYCTLFDSNYLTRGVVMYESLKRESKNFHLYIFAFDNKAHTILKKLKLKYVTIISLKQFEDKKLLKIKKTRSKAEYCWTCTPSIILYVLKKYNVYSCTYIDADVFFYKDPSCLIKEMGSKSVLITKHRYTKKYDSSKRSGIYCVQFITFKNDENGLKILKWWRDSCLDWCYARVEDGKFGDQKYLDDWTKRFDGVHVLKNIGGGVAPWNVQQYSVYVKNNSVGCMEKKTKKKFEIIFYHFHELKFLKKGYLDLGSYELSHNVIKYIYKVYLLQIININGKLKKLNIFLDSNKNNHKKNLMTLLKFFWRILNGRYNIHSLKKIIK